MRNKLVVVTILSLGLSTAFSAELVHQFQSPSFIPGNGYSSHVLTIEQLESQRKQKLKDEAKAAADAEARARNNTNLSKFLNNVESRIYAQLSKQLADAMFTDGGATSGTMNFQGTNISWVKNSADVTLTIIEANGNRTDVTVPIASFGF